MMPDWEQNARDAEPIICEAGDLLKECYTILCAENYSGLASRVKVFCDNVQQCMETGKPWTPASKAEGQANG